MNRYIVAVAAILFTVTAAAQERQDSLLKENNSIRDARAYSMQRRFRAKDAEVFKSYKFTDNTFAGLSIGRDNSFRAEFADGAEISLVAGKWLGALHGIRTAIVFANGKDCFDGGDVGRIGIKASYLFNLAHYLWGYNPYRFWDLSAVVGTGLSMMSYNQNRGLSLSGHLGLDFTFHAFRNVNFFLEPLLNVAYEPKLNRHSENWRRYVPAFNTSAGLIYSFRNKDYRSASANEKLYAFAGGGAIFHNNLINRTSNILFQGLGATANVGVGFNCGECIGFRTSAQIGNCLWDDNKKTGIRSNTYIALRAEAVFEILSAINARYSESRFGADVLLGPETGFLRKRDGDLVINSWYTGLTGGMLFRVRLFDRLSVCLEPRVTVIPYAAPTDKLAPQKYWERNYYDGLFCLNIGFLYRLIK